MRHGDKQNNLSRTASHRRALLMNLGCQLITHKRITTTVAKAKALRTYIEPLITKTKHTASKEVIMHNHRLVFSYLNDKQAIKELFTVVAPKVAGRPGGYTRIIKLGARVGDNAEMAMIELVDFNEVYGKHIDAASGAEPAKKTRRAGGAKKKTTEEGEPIKPTAKADDLGKIEGVGPKVAEALHNAGIKTFKQLAKMEPDAIKEILNNVEEGHFNLQDSTTWPTQAGLAAEGKWDELKTLQDELMGGK